MPPWLTPDREEKLCILTGYGTGFIFGVDTEYQTEIAKLGAGNELCLSLLLPIIK